MGKPIPIPHFYVFWPRVPCADFPERPFSSTNKVSDYTDTFLPKKSVCLKIIDDFHIRVKWVSEGQHPVEVVSPIDPG